MCLCIYVRVCMYFAQVSVCMHMSVYAYMCVSVHMRMCVCVYTCFLYVKAFRFYVARGLSASAHHVPSCSHGVSYQADDEQVIV